LRGWIEHARCFSEVMNGAALLYNLMLSEARGREDWIEAYEKQLARWQAMLGERGPAHASWDRARFWALVESGSRRIPIPTRHFVTQWITLVLDTHPLEIGIDAQRTLVRDRESMLKRGRARLLYPEYLQLYSGSAGADPLDYRWPTVQTIANDILRGLSGQRANAAAA
jgi:hypothetical protein